MCCCLNTTIGAFLQRGGGGGGGGGGEEEGASKYHRFSPYRVIGGVIYYGDEFYVPKTQPPLDLASREALLNERSLLYMYNDVESIVLKRKQVE